MFQDGTLVDGCYEIERDNIGPFVWTKREFCIQPARAGHCARLLMCHYGPGRLTIRCEGRICAQLELSDGWQSYIVPLEAAASRELLCELGHAHHVPGDTRELGVMLREFQLADDQATLRQRDHAGLRLDASLIEGFYCVEHDDVGPFVWTKLKFRLRPDRPARYARLRLCHQGPGQLTIRSGDNVCGELELAHGWQSYVVPIEGTADCELVCEVGQTCSATGDTRELGVMLREFQLLDDDRVYVMTQRAAENAVLNEREFHTGQTVLASYPPAIRITMEVRCNLPEVDAPCVYCAWDFAKAMERGSPSFTLQTLDDLGAFYTCAKNITDCSIGEPTMHRDFGSILHTLDADGKQIELTSNGQLLGARRRKELLGKDVILYVSIDSATAEGYARYRNRRFDDLVNNLRTLCREKKKHGDKPRVFVTCLAMRSNMEELPQYFDLMREIGVDEVKLRPLNVDGDLDLRATINNGYNFAYKDEFLSTQELKDLAVRARQLAAERGVAVCVEYEEFVAKEESTRNHPQHVEPREEQTLAVSDAVRVETAPPAIDASASDGQASVAETRNPPICSEPWKTLYVLRRGIMPCCYATQPLARWSDQGDRSLEQFLGDVFNSEQYQQMRTELAAGRLPEYCLNTASCPILKRMVLEDGIQPGPVAAPNLLPARRELPMISVESLIGSARKVA